MDKPKITEAEAEKMADRIVMRRLDTDSVYVNAEDADSKKTREEEIETEVWDSIERRYEIEH